VVSVTEPATEPATVPFDAADLRRRLAGDGFARLPGLIPRPLVDGVLAEFDDVLARSEEAPAERLAVLAHASFRALLDYPSVAAVPEAVFGEHGRLVECFPLFQVGPGAAESEAWARARTPRDWHRDFSYTGCEAARPAMVTLLSFFDETSDEVGPTVVLPGSHVRAAPDGFDADAVSGEEVPVPLRPGDALVMNSAIVHSRGLNRSDRPRRGVSMQFAYRWVAPLDEHLPLPAQAAADAPGSRRRLLGLDRAHHPFMYEPLVGSGEAR
jgi:ectoine hydroxylase-related dioxygenase (phytanoyl-CoA dioxygenase family)